MLLPLISIEQNEVIKKLNNNNNVIVDSVAGSGKTTCILHIAIYFKNLNILLLTYNKRLRLETKEKTIKLNISNLETHTYHSFCVKYYNNKCFTDKIIRDILKSNIKIKLKQKYDLIILDEAQDITPVYYELICKIYKDNYTFLNDNNILNKIFKENNDKKNNEINKCTQKGDPTICIFGDKYQSIFQFNNADERYIIYGDKLFNFNNLSWEKCKLSISFRITYQMSLFINNCLLYDERIKSNKKEINWPRQQTQTNLKIKLLPRYIICNCWKYPINELEYYLNLGYLPEDIFILAPSIKSPNNPIRQFENQIKNKYKNILIYVPNNDDDNLDEEILKNKLVFSTFHQTKGLERKVIIIFSFDESYFKYYKKNQDETICPNELYVATTRGLEHLTLLHNNENKILPFLNISNLKKYCNYLNIDNKEQIKDSKKEEIKTGVCNFIKYIPNNILDECIKLLKIKIIRNISKDIIFIENKISINNNLGIKGKKTECISYETVYEINGIAIPCYYELLKTGTINIFNHLKLIKFEEQIKEQIENIKLRAQKRPKKITLGNIVHYEENDIYKKYDLNNINIKKLTIGELLYISNCWTATINNKINYLYKIYQIKNYDWLSLDILKKCVNRLNTLNISKNAIFEYTLEGNLCYKNKVIEIYGSIDCIDINNKNIYEFKCVKTLDITHYLQIAIYMYLYIKNNNTENVNYYLYNILTNELIEISCNIENLKIIVEKIVEYKYFIREKINTDKFIKNTIKIKDKYFIK